MRETSGSKALKLDDLIGMGRNVETVKAQSGHITEDRINAIGDRQKKPMFGQRKFGYKQKEGFGKKETNRASSDMSKDDCKYCGRTHKEDKECPAKNKQCHKCRKYNHFASVCKSRDKEGAKKKDFTASISHDVVPRLGEKPGYAFAINDQKDRLPTKMLTINGCGPIKMYIDTCCTVNVINIHEFNRIKPKPCLKSVENEAFRYQNDNPIKFLGDFEAELQWSGRKWTTRIAVVDGDLRCLLGCEASVELGIVHIASSVTRPKTSEEWANLYPEVFSGKLGKLKGYQVKLDIDTSVKPVCVNIRPIPFNMRDKMEEVVQKGLLDGVFEVAKGPTTWLLNPKLVPKPDGRVRFVLDGSPTNGAIRRTRYVLPLIEDLIADINGANLFTKNRFS